MERERRQKDLVAASNALAQGTESLKASLGTDETKQLMTLLDSMLKTGNELITEASGLSSVMKEQIVAPVQGMMANAEYLMNQITAVQSYTVELAKNSSNGKRIRLMRRLLKQTMNYQALHRDWLTV